MEEVKSQYVIDKLKAGTKVTCVNFAACKILDCGGMTIDQLLSAINDPMCLFFVKTETTE